MSREDVSQLRSNQDTSKAHLNDSVGAEPRHNDKVSQNVFPFTSEDGRHGTIDLTDQSVNGGQEYVQVKAEDGRAVQVPSILMQQQVNGSFYFGASLAAYEVRTR